MAATTSALALVADVGFTILSDPKDAAIEYVSTSDLLVGTRTDLGEHRLCSRPPGTPTKYLDV